VPFEFVTAFNYQFPAITSNRFVRAAVRDWTFGGVLRYASGLPILAPTAQANLIGYLFQNTYMNRVPGVPLFLKNLNCHCVDPNKDFVLNSAAWSEPAVGNSALRLPITTTIVISGAPLRARVWAECSVSGKGCR